MKKLTSFVLALLALVALPALASAQTFILEGTVKSVGLRTVFLDASRHLVRLSSTVKSAPDETDNCEVVFTDNGDGSGFITGTITLSEANLLINFEGAVLTDSRGRTSVGQIHADGSFDFLLGGVLFSNTFEASCEIRTVNTRNSLGETVTSAVKVKLFPFSATTDAGNSFLLGVNIPTIKLTRII